MRMEEEESGGLRCAHPRERCGGHRLKVIARCLQYVQEAVTAMLVVVVLVVLDEVEGDESGRVKSESKPTRRDWLSVNRRHLSRHSQIWLT